MPEYDESADEFKIRIINDHWIAWCEKPFYLICKSQWYWLKSGKFIKEWEGLIFAAQEQALSTNASLLHLIAAFVVYQIKLLTILQVTVHFWFKENTR